jgi:hypothetical protein
MEFPMFLWFRFEFSEKSFPSTLTETLFRVGGILAFHSGALVGGRHKYSTSAAKELPRPSKIGVRFLER